jgi:hypothetical protein
MDRNGRFGANDRIDVHRLDIILFGDPGPCRHHCGN